MIAAYSGIFWQLEPSIGSFRERLTKTQTYNSFLSTLLHLVQSCTYYFWSTKLKKFISFIWYSTQQDVQIFSYKF